jgi:hypothetical protein
MAGHSCQLAQKNSTIFLKDLTKKDLTNSVQQ